LFFTKHSRPLSFVLSDASQPDRGNFYVIPSSHLVDKIEMPEGGKGQPAGALPVLAKPCAAVFFDRRLWHTASPNSSDITRKVLFYGYGYRWLRTKDDMTVQTLWEKSDPIRKQMLGYGVNCNGFYSPTDAEVPLRTWLKEHSPDEAK
jgi:ectoine hydroxylase-related dioxygenase (phytanoyl-CoA dioxygenase family)